MSPVYLPIEPDEQWHRVSARLERAPESTFPTDRNDLDRHRSTFEPLDAAELDADSPPDPPPSGWTTWAEWTAERWPSSLG